MKPDRLIRNNAYLYTDPDGQAHTVLFNKVISVGGQLVYNFQSRVGFINLTEQMIADNIVPSPRTRV